MVKKHVYVLVTLICLLIGIIHAAVVQTNVDKDFFLFLLIILNDSVNFQSLNVDYYWLYFFTEYNRAVEPVLRIFYSWLLVGIWNISIF